jgi:S1-C subfamily serine protease
VSIDQLSTCCGPDFPNSADPDATSGTVGTCIADPLKTPTAAPPKAAAPTLDIPELVRQAEPSVVTVLAGNGVGSGIVYKDDGTIVTNAHVVADARQATVAFADAGKWQRRCEPPIGIPMSLSCKQIAAG